jgi:hypothetical protein
LVISEIEKINNEEGRRDYFHLFAKKRVKTKKNQYDGT